MKIQFAQMPFYLIMFLALSPLASAEKGKPAWKCTRDYTCVSKARQTPGVDSGKSDQLFEFVGEGMGPRTAGGKAEAQRIEDSPSFKRVVKDNCLKNRAYPAPKSTILCVHDFFDAL